jgi:hypothetical protein
MNVIARERLVELLDYDQETGEFTWRGTRSGRGKTNLTAAGARAGTTGGSGYRIIRIDRINHRAHRLAWLYVHGEMPAEDIDHINGIRTDNRISNLRSVSRSVNLQNMREPKSNNRGSGLLGTYKVGNRWYGKLQVNGRAHSCGGFDTPEEAHQAYVDAKRRLHAGCTI